MSDRSVAAFVREETDVDRDLDDDTNLIESGLVDSLDFLKLLSAIEDQFGIALDFDSVDPNDLTRLGTLVSYCEQSVGSQAETTTAASQADQPEGLALGSNSSDIQLDRTCEENVYTTDDLRSALRQVGITDGDLVFVHSSLDNLGFIQNERIDDYPQIITTEVTEHLGEDGGLFVPTFNFGFASGDRFDITETPSQMGVLTEHIRTMETAVRSPHPMQSIAGIGSHAQEVCRRDTTSAFDLDGTIDALRQKGAKVLLLGAPIKYNSLVHYVEQDMEVPYRYWKEFEGEYVDREGNMSVETYEMYVRNLHLDPTIDQSVLADRLRDNQLIHSAELGAGTITSFEFEDFIRETAAALRDDPFALIEEW